MAIDILIPARKENHLDCAESFPSPRKQLLSEKLAHFRLRMTKSEELMDRIRDDQKKMKHSVTVIHHDQEVIVMEQHKQKETQLILAKRSAHIKHNFLTIQQWEANLSLTLKCLVYCSLDIYRKQEKAKKDLTVIKRRKKTIFNQISLIHHDNSAIKEQIQDIQGLANAIEEKESQIKSKQKLIKNVLVDIQTKSQEILNKMPILYSEAENNKDYIFSKDKKFVQQNRIDWFRKMQEFCLRIIAFLGEKVKQVYRYFVG